MATSIRNFKILRRITATGFACGILALAQFSHADSFNQPRDEAFYHQLLKLPESQGYLPTRSFTIIVDTQHGNQLVAEDDPNLRFNLLWMEQFKPGYRSTRGGSAFGELFRSYLKSAYKTYRERNAQAMAALPDENGSINAKDNAASLIDAMDYNLKVTTDEVRFKIQYRY